MNNPIIHILLATYNRENLIVETLTSIKKQQYREFKCLIVDDRSTDGTAEVVREFCDQDSRFQYFIKPESYIQGLPDSRNYSLDLAKDEGATYIQFFDDDDLMHPQKLQLQMQAMQAHPEASLSCCDYKSFNDTAINEIELLKNPEQQLEKNLGFKFIWRQIAINSLGPIFKSDLFDNLRFTKDLVIGEERELYLKMFYKYDVKVVWVKAPLFYYRKHKQSNTGSRYTPQQKEESNRTIYRNLYDYYEREGLLTNNLLVFLGHYFCSSDQKAEQLDRLDSYLRQRKGNRFKNNFLRLFLRSNSFLRKMQLKLLLSNP